MSGKEGRVRPISWLFYTILLPIIFFVIIMAFVAQMFFGFNVVGKVNAWMTGNPVIRHAMGLPPVLPPVASQVLAVRIELNKATQEVGQLRTGLAQAQTQVQTSQGLIAKLRAELKQTQASLRASSKLTATAASDAQIYTNMSADQAAKVLVQLPFALQVRTLHAMDAADTAAILAAMSPTVAAKLLQAGA